MRRPRTFTARSHVPLISEDEAWRRVLAAIRTMKALPSAKLRGIVSNWPSEFEFHATAIKVAVFSGDLEDKKFLKLRAKDFDDVYLGPPVDDSDTPRRRASARDVGDVDVAGRWFADLALLPRYDRERRECVEHYRTGRASTPQIVDQRILAMFAEGHGFNFIGGIFKLDENQIERRLCEIRRAVFGIANRPQRSADPSPAQRTRSARQTQAARR